MQLFDGQRVFFCYQNIRKGSIYVKTWFVDDYIGQIILKHYMDQLRQRLAHKTLCKNPHF